MWTQASRALLSCSKWCCRNRMRITFYHAQNRVFTIFVIFNHKFHTPFLEACAIKQRYVLSRVDTLPCLCVTAPWLPVFYTFLTVTHTHTHTLTRLFHEDTKKQIQRRKIVTEEVYLPISWQLPYHHISPPARPAWLSAPVAHGLPFLDVVSVFLSYVFRSRMRLCIFLFFNIYCSVTVPGLLAAAAACCLRLPTGHPSPSEHFPWLCHHPERRVFPEWCNDSCWELRRKKRKERERKKERTTGIWQLITLQWGVFGAAGTYITSFINLGSRAGEAMLLRVAAN